MAGKGGWRMRLFSSAFEDGGVIPQRYTCDGENTSPPLEWSAAPPGTQAYVMIVDDPDAPSGTFVHWLLYDIPVSENGLTEAVGKPGAEAGGGLQGRNGFGDQGYGGPCPPSGTHRYYFRLYALQQSLRLPAGARRQEVEQAMEGRVMEMAELMGRYERAAGPK